MPADAFSLYCLMDYDANQGRAYAILAARRELLHRRGDSPRPRNAFDYLSGFHQPSPALIEVRWEEGRLYLVRLLPLPFIAKDCHPVPEDEFILSEEAS